RFDAVMEAYIEGSWQSIIPEGSQWTYCPDPAAPAATDEPVIHCLRYPLAGMPAVTEPGGRFRMILDTGCADFHTALLDGPRGVLLLPPPEIGAVTEQGQTYDFELPENVVPGTYDLRVFTSAQPDGQIGSRSSVTVIPQAADSLSIVHISDSHVPFRGQYSRDNTQALLRVMDGFAELQPDLVIHTGDGYDEGNGRDQAELFRSIVDSAGFPIVYVGGNHELGEWCGDGSGRDNYWDFFGWPELDPRRPDHWTARTRDYVMDIGNVSLVCVETWESYSNFWTDWYPYDSISTDQAQWMMQVAEDRPGRTLVACYHHDFSGALEQEVLPWAGYTIGLSGHTHSADSWQVGPVQLYKVGSTYQVSRPQRWFHFHDGIPEGGDLLMADPVDLEFSPVPD
ncbi:MAG TPA: metallophosphoesterase, partial [bacterium]|nr:metallophosphoesterase [bacterium]